MPKLSGTDYVLWILIILVLFFVYLWIGNFGNLEFLTTSPTSTYVETLWKLTYLASGIIFAVFMGSIIFLAARFRLKRSVTTERSLIEEQRRVNSYYALGLALNLVAAIFITYMIFNISYSSLTNLMQNQFLIGLLVSADLMVFASIIYLVYKQFFD
ncbi:MAG: quinol oxidase subunit 2 [Sulfolobaceae archaeon]